MMASRLGLMDFYQGLFRMCGWECQGLGTVDTQQEFLQVFDLAILDF